MKKQAGRPSTGSKQFNIRLTDEQHRRLQQIAKMLDYVYNSEGSLSLLVQAIADAKVDVTRNDEK